MCGTQASLLVNQSQPWSFNFNHNPFWHVFGAFSIGSLFHEGSLGYSTWVAFFYTAVALLVASLALCAFVASSSPCS